MRSFAQVKSFANGVCLRVQFRSFVLRSKHSSFIDQGFKFATALLYGFKVKHSREKLHLFHANLFFLTFKIY